MQKKSRTKPATGATGVERPPESLSKRARHLLLKYGITEAQYDELLQNQNEACAVCKRHYSSFKQKLCVDHDHSTGHIRGLLCIYCNRRIVGRHRRELGAELLASAAEYLFREYPGWTVPVRKKRHGKRLAKRKRNAKKPKS